MSIPEMTQSITFLRSTDELSNMSNYINTWEDWHLLPIEKPVFAPPEPKSTLIDVPGGNGVLDLSEALTGYPTYGNRTGSFTFRVIQYTPFSARRPWSDVYSEIANYLHGQKRIAILHDDPQWFYEGRFKVESWTPADTWSEITIGYDVGPFKWSVQGYGEPWMWDPTDFSLPAIPGNELTATESTLTVPGKTPAGEAKIIVRNRYEAPVTPIINANFSGGVLTLDAAVVNTTVEWMRPILSQVNVKSGDNIFPDLVMTTRRKEYGEWWPVMYNLTFRYAVANTPVKNAIVTIKFREGRL